MALRDELEWVGSTIDDRYAIVEAVGEGGQGVVYRARHIGFDEAIAVKFLRLPKLLAEGQRDELLANFRAEARLLHRLSRKTASIVQALDIGAATSPSGSWVPYIVMEWLEGRSLEAHFQSYLDEHGPMGLPDAIEVLRPVAAALSVAHRSGICHLDIKPPNVFVCDDGEQPIKVLDFGIAKVLSGSAITQSSDTGVRLFTPAYAAPEQFNARHGPRGPWTDVFAVALILVELLSGESPLGQGHPSEMYAAAVDERRRPTADLPVAVQPVIARALSVEPEARFRDMTDFWGHLDKALRDDEHNRITAPVAPWPGTHQRPVQADMSAPTMPTDGEAKAAGENRVCSVMFVTVDGLSDLRGQLDPEQVSDIVDRCFGYIRDCVEAVGGEVVSQLGDSVMAVFGLERASDNDAERAVHAALDARGTFADYRLPHRALREVRIGIRVGIATGRVFARRGASSLVTGEPVDVARALAQTEGIELARDTYRLVAGLFTTRRSASTYRVEGVAAPSVAVAAPEFCGEKQALLGREAELAMLLDAFETVVSDKSARIVTIVGAAGLGRTHLLAELAARIGGRARGWAATGTALASDNSYGVLASALRASFHIHVDDPPDVIESKLRHGIRSLRQPHGELYPSRTSTTAVHDEGTLDTPEMVTILSQLLVGRQRALPDAESMAPDESGNKVRNRIAVAMSSLILRVERPVVFYIDDLQWLDDATLELIDDWGRRAVPLMVVCAARPTFFERRPLWGEGKEQHQRIELRPLARRHIEQMVRDRLKRASPSDELIRRLAEHAEGSPLTLDETLYLMIDAGVIDADAWQIHEARLGELSLPTTVQGLVQARIDRLAERERYVLLRAAVVGRTFWDGSLVELGADAASLGDALDVLRTRGFVHERDTSLFPDEREFVFAESATQRVGVDALSGKVRRRMHRQAAQWLEGRTGDAGAALCARHLELAGEVSGAVRAFMAAGSHAAALGQHAAAKANLERASRLEEEARSPSSQSLLGAGDVLSWRERVNLWLQLGDVMRRMGEHDAAERCYSAAEERILGDAASRETDRYTAQVAYRRALSAQHRGAFDEVRQLAQRALDHGGSPAEIAAMWALMAAALSRQNLLDECTRVCLSGLRVCREEQRRDARWRAAVSELLVTLGAVLYRRQRWVSAERCFLQASRAVSERDDPYQVGRALNNVAATSYQRGDVERAQHTWRRVLGLAQRSGDVTMTMTVLSNLAETEHSAGHHQRALEHAQEAVRLGEQIGAQADLADSYRNLAAAACALGQSDEALKAAERALDLAVSSGRVYLPSVALTVAEVCGRFAGGLTKKLEGVLEDDDLADVRAECRRILTAS